MPVVPRSRPRRRPAPRLRRLLRRPWVRLTVAVSTAAMAAVVTGSASADAERSRQQWGEAETVAVATRRLAAGETVPADAVTHTRWPRAMVPSGTATDPAGRMATATIVAGEAFLDERLAPGGLGGLAALVPAGWRALAVPLPSTAALPLAPGDVVDLLATFGTVAAGTAGEDGPPTVTVARAGRVLAGDERSVTVAVPVDAAGPVAFALTAGTVVPALRGAG
ncbi:MAG: Flp pilus assembly protein CpaB [Acidimicrobiia bacterium]